MDSGFSCFVLASLVWDKRGLYIDWDIFWLGRLLDTLLGREADVSFTSFGAFGFCLSPGLCSMGFRVAALVEVISFIILLHYSWSIMIS
jgi:hypothetical protein